MIFRRHAHAFRRAALCVAAALAACAPEPETLRFQGETMGTTYSVVVARADPSIDPAAVQAAIADTLRRVNANLSNWDPGSEVSRFNAAQATTPVALSDDFATVMAASDRVHVESDGAFDLTVGPLVSLWGFGPRRPDSPVPSDAAVAAALRDVGQARLLAFDAAAGRLAKAAPDVAVDLGGVAKGYGVDAIAAALRALGATDYLVEIGGDLIAAGRNPDDKPWRIAIERPDPSTREIHRLVDVSGFGLATSGDYRNYFEQDGVRYAHIIDPRTGLPINHGTASVTVLADSAAAADAWATALLVLGFERGAPLADDAGVAALFILRSAPGAFSVETTARFQTAEREGSL